MAQFLGDIAFVLELGFISAGLVLVHVGREQSARLIRAAGWLLVVGATAAAVCTSYFWLRYHWAGDFDRAALPVRAEQLSRGHDCLDSLAIAWLAWGLCLGREALQREATR